MNASPNRVIVPSLLLALACGVFAYLAGAGRAAAPKEVVMASVDLEKVFDSLAERVAEDARLTALGEQRKAEDEAYKTQIRDMAAELENVPQGTPMYDTSERELVKKTIEYESWSNFTVRELDRERAIVLRKLYAKVKEELARLSGDAGYDVVVLNDSLNEIAPDTAANVTQQISARRFLYVNPTIDITNELIDRMNNRFNSSN
jgi:Skp family chaperone for outer membrane proteins